MHGRRAAAKAPWEHSEAWAGEAADDWWSSATWADNHSQRQEPKWHQDGRAARRTAGKASRGGSWASDAAAVGWDQRKAQQEEKDLGQEVVRLSQAAQSKFNQLSSDGKQIWETLTVCIGNILIQGLGHFERELRDELRDAFAETYSGSEVHLKRESGSQWVVTINVPGQRARHVYYASVRSEMLGDSAKGRAILKQLKDSAREVKDVLLGNNAECLRDLCNGTRTRDDFLKQVRRRQPVGPPAGRPLVRPEGGPCCHVCGLSLRTNLLGGRHCCRIVATFQCCGRWTSQRARYDANEERVMGQKCQRCQEWGEVVEWELSDDQTGTSAGGDETREHLSNLCEACDRYGNCTGVFYDPFIMTLAVQNVLPGRKVHWETDGRGEVWTTQVEGCVLALQPHVHQGPSERLPAAPPQLHGGTPASTLSSHPTSFHVAQPAQHLRATLKPPTPVLRPAMPQTKVSTVRAPASHPPLPSHGQTQPAPNQGMCSLM